MKIGLPFERITVIDPYPSADMQALAAKGRTLNLALESFAPQAVLVLAVRPQMFDEAAPSLNRPIGEGTVVLSILAGQTTANIQERLPAALAVVRAMPNLPAAIGRGVTGAVGSAGLTPVQQNLAQALLSGVGSVEWLDDEAQIDAVTAISGSDPAYSPNASARRAASSACRLTSGTASLAVALRSLWYISTHRQRDSRLHGGANTERCLR